MCEGAASLAVGLVGGDDAMNASVRKTGASVTSGDAATVLAAGPDVIVAIGEASLLSVARERPAIPILPVEAGAGVRSVAPVEVGESLNAIAGDDCQTETHPVLTVEAGDADPTPALFDATLVAAEPARISAFSISVGDEQTGPVRADGVVIATAAGSTGYAGALEAPTIHPAADVLAVEPIAQFATRPDRWVVPASALTVTVARDEVPVEVLADDRAIGEVGPGEPVRVTPDGSIETVVVPASPSALATGDAELEKH